MLRTTARPAAFLLMAPLPLPPANLAYEAPLASRLVRDDYLLGQRNNEHAEAFIRLYARRFNLPPGGWL